MAPLICSTLMVTAHYGALRRREQEPSIPSPFARISENMSDCFGASLGH